MRNSDTVFQSGKSDDQFTNLSQYLCSKGTLEIIGKLYFYENAWIPFNYAPAQGKHPAGELPIGSKPPEEVAKYSRLKINRSKSVDHKIKVKWDCCPTRSDKKPTVMVSKTP